VFDGGELAAVVPRGMRHGEAADEAVRTVDADVIL
jgi:hypothetical protein